MADTTNAANWNSSQGNTSGPGYADSSENNIPQNEVDPKHLFDDWTSTQNAPAGNYPYGIDVNNSDIFMPITDNTDAQDINTGSRHPASMLPQHPLSGEMASRSAKRTIPRS